MVAKTTPAAPVDPFAALLETAEVAEKRSTPTFEGIVPPEWIARVEAAYDKSERVTLKVTDKDTFTSVSALLRAAGDKSGKNITVTCKAVYNTVYKRDEKNPDAFALDAKGEKIVESETLTGLSFTVGNRRGQKPKTSDAPAAK